MKKKLISVCLVIGILSTSAAVLADNILPEGFVPADGARMVANVLPEGFVPADGARDNVLPEGFVPADGAREDTKEEAHSSYVTYDLTIAAADGKTLTATAKNDEGTDTDYLLTVGDNTLIYDAAGNKKAASDIKKDTKILAFNGANKAMLAIYPISFTPDVIVIAGGDNANSATVDTFVKSETLGEFVNPTNMLALNIGEDTKIVDTDGKDVKKDDLAGRDLVVFYSIVTFSIPGQTTPSKVIVLPEVEADAPVASTPAKVVVNSKEIKGSIETVDDVVMLPVREVSEALGLEVGWNDLAKAVSIGSVQMGVNINIGKNEYSKAKTVPQQLKAAPTLIAGKTYVPAEFFTEVVEGELTTSGDTMTINLK